VPLDILLIDDHPLVADALKVVIQREGHRVSVASSGREGVETFLAWAGQGRPFHVVMTDYSMSDLDGLQVASAVKAASPATRVILLTAYQFSPADPLPANVDAVVSKPPDLATLRTALNASN
jgi:CheY-like chemotaxis protein